MSDFITPAEDLLMRVGNERYGTILADPPWRFSNKTGKMAPEHKRLRRYETLSFQEINELPVAQLALPKSHLYLWVPNALILEGLEVMRRWGFTYKTQIVWFKTRKDGGPDGRGVGFYFRNVTEVLLFGTRGNLRTGPAGRRQVNIIVKQKREHSRKPDEQYPLIESCSPGPYLELFARGRRNGWAQWGNEVDGRLESQARTELQLQLEVRDRRAREYVANHDVASCGEGNDATKIRQRVDKGCDSSLHERNRTVSRKEFIESHGGTCRNWRWSWSFINDTQKMIIFGAWDTQTSGNRSLILDEEWERSALGKRQPGYKQALEHIRLVESGAYTLHTFPISYSDAQVDAIGNGPAMIGDFAAELRPRSLTKIGRKWYAEG